MCANYLPVTNADELLAFFGIQRDAQADTPPELYPTGLGPFIRLVNGQREFEAGRFGLLPPWRREVAYGRSTYNARSETVSTKASFKESWARGLRCVIPAKAVFEPKYAEDLTSERWRIEKEDGTPFGIAGLYSQWVEHGIEKFSYAPSRRMAFMVLSKPRMHRTRLKLYANTLRLISVATCCMPRVRK